jgi:hypothetical protein
LMMAAVLTLLWRQVPSVHELTRLLAREDLLWCNATPVSQAALGDFQERNYPETGQMRISHLGNRGLRFKRSSMATMACLVREIPF